MAALRNAGYVVSTGGPGGGWSLTADFAQLTVADIYRAIGSSEVFAFGPSDDNPSCPVEGASNRFLLDAMASAEQVLNKQLMSRKLKDLVNDLGSINTLS